MKYCITTKSKQIMFVLLTSIIYLLAYTVYVFATNSAQYHILQNHFSPHIFPQLSMMGSLITTMVLILCFFEKFQKLNYQFILISALILTLMIIPITLDTFPIMAGFSNGIYNLTEPWRQLYVPPAIRATMEGITTSFTGLLSIRAVNLESVWDPIHIKYHYATVVLSICVFFFWWLTQALKNSELKNQITQNPETSLRLVTKYPYIFMICFMSGLDQGLFNYSFFLGHEILNSPFIKTYQYLIYIASIISPVIMGRIADKYGVFLMILLSSLMITICKFSNVILALLHISSPIYYWVVAFFEAAYTSCLWMLAAALIGERLRTKGIFRSFALSNVAFAAGLFSCGIIYNHFPHSFLLTKLSIGCFNLLLIGTFSYFYVKHRNI